MFAKRESKVKCLVAKGIILAVASVVMYGVSKYVGQKLHG